MLETAVFVNGANTILQPAPTVGGGPGLALTYAAGRGSPSLEVEGAGDGITCAYALWDEPKAVLYGESQARLRVRPVAEVSKVQEE